MNTEPTRLIGAIQAAIAATIGILTLTETIGDELGGALTVALGAWIVVAHEILRSRVTPVETPQLTPEQAAKVEVRG